MAKDKDSYSLEAREKLQAIWEMLREKVKDGPVFIPTASENEAMSLRHQLHKWRAEYRRQTKKDGPSTYHAFDHLRLSIDKDLPAIRGDNVNDTIKDYLVLNEEELNELKKREGDPS